MQRLIDADALRDYFHIGGDETSCEGCEHLKLKRLGCYEEWLLSDFCSAIDEQPTVDAVPIEFIEKRIAELKKLNEYEFIANGGYTSPSDYEQWELERLIRDWREQND